MFRGVGLRKTVEQPVLDLNFAASQIGSNAAPDSRIDFSRGSNAWFVDTDGLVKKSPHNLILASETFVHGASGWLVSGASLEASLESPDGIDGSTKVTWSGTGQLYNLTSGIVAGQTYRFSYYVKLGTKVNNRYAFYDHTNSAFIISSAVTSGVSSSEWTRVNFTVTAPSGCTQIRFYPDRADSGGETGTTFITGVQLSQHTTLPVDNPYIKTTGSAVYAARLDHDPTWFMSAAQEQNLLETTDLDNNTQYGLGRSTIAEQSSVENPFGGTDGVYLHLESAVGGSSYIYLFSQTNWQQYVTEGKQYTLSIYAKQFSGQKLELRSPNSDSRTARFNVDTGVIEDQDSLLDDATIEGVGNGWFRCSITDTIATFSSTTWILAFLYNDLASPDYGLYYYGAQLEVGSTASTYHRTEGAPYYGEGATPRGLLVEEARTNLVQHSEEFDDSYFTTARASVTANAALAPDGTTTADELVENTDNNTHLIRFDDAVASGTTYTMSVFAKAASGDRRLKMVFNTHNSGFAFSQAVFRLDNGTVSNTSCDNATIEDFGNGWFRCTATETATATTSAARFILHINDTSGSTYTGDGSSGFLLWGLQVEAGSFPTSYIKTTGSTATRNADVTVMGPTTGGTELVTNGTFDTDSDWTVTPVASITGGELVYSSAGQFKNTDQIIAGKFVAGRRYRFACEVTSYTSGTFKAIYLEDTTNRGSATRTSTGSVTFDFTCVNDNPGGNGNRIRLQSFASSNNNFSIDNVSVRELYPFEQYNSAEGTVLFEANVPAGMRSYGAFFNIADDGVYTDRISIINNDTNSQVYTQARSGGTALLNTFGNSVSYTLGQNFRVAFAYAASDFASTVDATTVRKAASGAVPPMDSIKIGIDAGNATPGSFYARRVRIFPKRLPDSILQSLTSD